MFTNILKELFANAGAAQSMRERRRFELIEAFARAFSMHLY